jgi:hypothetical protein
MAVAAAVRRALYLMRQSRLALNRDAGRVHPVLLATQNCCDRAFLAREHAELVVATLRPGEAAALLGHFPVYDGTPVTQAGRIYLIDPLGNLMMSYAAHAPDKALLEDLQNAPGVPSVDGAARPRSSAPL